MVPVRLAGRAPRIKHRRAYEAGRERLPDWRITCFFVARTHRRAGVASVALAGALREIEWLGGGTVESHPEDVEGRTVSGSSCTTRPSGRSRTTASSVRRLGKHHWVVRTHVGATPGR